MRGRIQKQKGAWQGHSRDRSKRWESCMGAEETWRVRYRKVPCMAKEEETRSAETKRSGLTIPMSGKTGLM